MSMRWGSRRDQYMRIARITADPHNRSIAVKHARRANRNAVLASLVTRMQNASGHDLAILADRYNRMEK